jgi:hypothetical protein
MLGESAPGPENVSACKTTTGDRLLESPNSFRVFMGFGLWTRGFFRNRIKLLGRGRTVAPS